MRESKTWTVSLPPTLEKDALKIAKAEHRTKSELVREALREYLIRWQWEEVQRKASAKAKELGVINEDTIDSIIQEHRKQQ